jgi:hypothetical protein
MARADFDGAYHLTLRCRFTISGRRHGPV